MKKRDCCLFDRECTKDNYDPRSVTNYDTAKCLECLRIKKQLPTPTSKPITKVHKEQLTLREIAFRLAGMNPEPHITDEFVYSILKLLIEAVNKQFHRLKAYKRDYCNEDFYRNRDSFDGLFWKTFATIEEAKEIHVNREDFLQFIENDLVHRLTTMYQARPFWGEDTAQNEQSVKKGRARRYGKEREQCRDLARELWTKTPKLKTTEVIGHLRMASLREQFNTEKGWTFTVDTLRTWIQNLNPRYKGKKA